MTRHLPVLDCRLFKHISYFMPLLRPNNTLSVVTRISVAPNCYFVVHSSKRAASSLRLSPETALSSLPTARTGNRLVLGAGPQKHNIIRKQSHLGERSFSISRSKMASDEDYMSFLDKANKDPSEGYARSQTTQKDEQGFKATEQGVEIPRAIAKVVGKGEAFYVSDADEPFEAVALKLGGSGLPDEEEFARLINHPAPKEASVEILDPVDWDRNGQYSEVIDAVREAGEGNDVRVYRVARGGVKAEYWVITATSDNKLVGVKALAVES